ncbi:MAG TPA: NUDIX hydrolase [Candidatus Saccharimonadales bacterium]|nr:NUDIX hydrolase [Candidatus Saccharimonadales bacterium]
MDTIPCTYRLSVKAVIRDKDGRVLLLREADGRWELPGGGLEHGEDPKAALAREVAEETGLTVEWMSNQPIAFWTIRKEVGSPTLKWFAFVAYDARVSGEFRPDPAGDEAQEAKYFTTDEAKALPLHDNAKPYFL